LAGISAAIAAVAETASDATKATATFFIANPFLPESVVKLTHTGVQCGKAKAAATAAFLGESDFLHAIVGICDLNVTIKDGN
jgi:hypothetical protein